MVYSLIGRIKNAEWQYSLLVNLTADLSRSARAEAEYRAAQFFPVPVTPERI